MTEDETAYLLHFDAEELDILGEPSSPIPARRAPALHHQALAYLLGTSEITRADWTNHLSADPQTKRSLRVAHELVGDLFPVASRFPESKAEL